MQARLALVLAVLFLFPVAQGQNATQSVNSPATTPANPFGTFTGTLTLRPTGDGVNMLVVDPYSYTDPDGHMLSAGSGFKTDGASIPRALWTIVGSPFTGKYIGAAVIHDVGCETHKYSWQVTHRMFYTAMRALGVSDDYALLLYWGVRAGGPKWKQAVVYGNSPDEVKRQAQVQYGLRLGDSTITKNHVGSTKSSLGLYEALVVVSLPQDRVLSDEEVKSFEDHIELRANTVRGAVTVDEIDRLTPLTDSSKYAPINPQP